MSALSPWRVLCVPLLLACLNTIPVTAKAQTAAEYRQVLDDLLNLVEQAYAVTGLTDHQASILAAADAVTALSDEEIEQVFATAVPLQELQQRLAAARQEIELLQTLAAHGPTRPFTNPGRVSEGPQLNAIDIPSIDVDPAFCVNTTGAASFIALALSKTLKTILKAAEFSCLETIFGENAAALCTAPEVLSDAADFEYEFGQFCLNEQRAASGEAILELDRNIGRHLNAYIDETSSSRATQDSLDTLQTDITTAQSDVETLQDTLDSAFNVINHDLNSALTDLDNLETSLTDIISRTDDIQFRVQVNQVDIEEAQTLAADLQESTEEIRTDTESIITSAASLQSSANALSTVLDSGFSQLQSDAIAAALANPLYSIADYALPESEGGQLEAAREVLIQAILDLESLNIGDTDTALILLAQGDQAYNAGNYLSAYQLFAQSYQSLTTALRR